MQEIIKPQITHEMKLVLSGKCNANSANKELGYFLNFGYNSFLHLSLAEILQNLHHCETYNL